MVDEIDRVRKRLEELIATINPGHFVYTYPPHKIYPKIIPDINPLDAWGSTEQKDLNIYFHIPFCRQKCGYCNIESIAIKEDATLIDEYLDALVKEMEMYREVIAKFNVITAYVGGGTPSYLSAEQMRRFFGDIVSEISDTRTLKEFCIEISPDSTTLEKLEVMKEFGITRVSLGLQSLDKSQIREMGRKYSDQTPIDIFRALKETGFENINIDIIYGHPDQTIDMLKDTLSRVLDLIPGTISLYPLNVKPLTRFWKKIGYEGVDKSKIDSMYDYFKPLLISEGYVQDTRLRFLLPKVGRYAHKDETIKGKPVKGFGSAAQSYAEYIHYRPSYSVSHCRRDILEYTGDIQAGRHPARYAFILDDNERMRRAITMNIRHSAFSREAFHKKFGTYPEDVFSAEFQLLYEDGFLERDGNLIKLTEKGFKRADAVAKLFFSEAVLKMQRDYVYE